MRLEINANAPKVDPIIKVSIWSIGEANLAIVAGAILMFSIQKSMLNLVPACLPSLRPILSLILHGEPNPSARGTRRKGFSRTWTRIRPSAGFQTHGRPTSASDNHRNYTPLPDEAYGFSEKVHLHGNASTSSEAPRTREREDIEMQTGGRWLNVGIQVRSDVTAQPTQKR